MDRLVSNHIEEAIELNDKMRNILAIILRHSRLDNQRKQLFNPVVPAPPTVPPPKSNKTMHCGVLMYDPNEESVLLVYQKASKMWSIPKGSCNDGEDHKECALRELAEETSIRIPVEHLIMRHIKHKNYIFYPVEVAKKQYSYRINDRREIGEIKWVKLTEVDGLPLNKPSSSAINTFRRRLTNELTTPAYRPGTPKLYDTYPK